MSTYVDGASKTANMPLYKRNEMSTYVDFDEFMSLSGISIRELNVYLCRSLLSFAKATRTL